MNARPATELLPHVAGRAFSARRSVRLGDVDPSGQLRFDGIARYLQDVASDDALDAALPNALGWVVRRTMIRVERTAALGEHLTLTTYCTGSGRSWAERRTSIVGDQGAVVEAVSLWVQVEPVSGRPARLGEEFYELYGESAAGRIVSSKLSLPGPTDAVEHSTWSYRCADLDPFGHVNNAAHWATLEEIVQTRGLDRCGVAELEYLAPVEAGQDGELQIDGSTTDRTLSWLICDGRVAAATRWTPST